jgi:putative Holliday junction resolvase
MANILAVDYGEKRVGLAIADENLKIPLILKPIIGKTEKQVLEDIAKICQEKDVKKIVVGLPLSFDFKENPKCQKIRKFAEKIKELVKVEIVFENEVFSTEAAKNIQRSFNKNNSKNKLKLSRKDLKNHFDSQAAAIILDSYLTRIK